LTKGDTGASASASERVGLTSSPEPAPASASGRVSARPEASAKSGYRPFLDGLRAVAVLGVLVYHLDRDWLPGGYLGVDIFFVLSGYLITMLLLAEHANSGRINLPAFWSRRIRRLFPALLVMLTVMAVLIDINGDPLAIGQARGDLLSTLFYVANWHFITSGQSYFTQFLAVSPDRHTWSLAIEEQFYLFWPLVTAFVLARFRRSALAVVAASVATASALWMVVIFDGADPSRAYFGTDSRIFEILIGALLAIGLGGPARDRLLRFGRRVAPLALAAIALAYVGLADDNALYYRGGAVLLSLAVAGLIAGLEAGSPIDRLLSLKPLVLVGLASYGMYLWHFPVIIFTNLWLGPTYELANAAVAVAITFAATAVSYVVVETPIRRRGLLIGYKLTPARLARVVPAASAIVAVVIVATTLGGVTDPNWASDDPPEGVSVYTPPPQVQTPAPGTPTPAGPTQPARPDPTIGATPIGGPGWKVGLVGDSVMDSAVPGFQAEAARRGWSLVVAVHRGCPVGPGTLAGSAPSDCAGVAKLDAQLIAAQPDVIIWHDLMANNSRMGPDGKVLTAGTDAWRADLFASWNDVLGRLRTSGAPVFVILPPLRSTDRAGCRGAVDPARCRTIQSQDTIVRAATQQWFDSLDGEPGVYLVEIDTLLCPTGYPCPKKVDDIQIRYPGSDQTHPTDAGARWLAPRILNLVVRQLVVAASSPPPGSPSPAPSTLP
jgi:peptidoglycan/LPS O-acetylase OafA/YrhL